MKYTGPKARRSRRQGVNLFTSDKYDRILQRKPYPPGKSPRSRRGKLSEYGTQLLEKQKVRDMFGVSERQFRRVLAGALRSKQATGARVLQMLELRFDNVLFRAGFALTRLQARQMAGHGLFRINARRVNVPSHAMKPGDRIEAHKHAASSPLFTPILAATEKLVPPAWLRVNPTTLSVEILTLPAAEHFEQGIDIQKVVELYSR